MPGLVVWDLWAQWHRDRFLSEFIGFPLSISFHCGSPYSYIIWKMNNRLRCCSSETLSRPIDMEDDGDNNNMPLHQTTEIKCHLVVKVNFGQTDLIYTMSQKN
jgi:hypothetical protein